MFDNLRLSSDARDFALAFEGAHARCGGTPALLGLAGALARGAAIPASRGVATARAALQAAVIAETTRRRTHPTVAVRARGAVVGAAAAAGAGLLVASAASGSDPVSVVRQAVAAIPYVPDAALSAPVTITVDGVLAADAPGTEFMLATNRGSVTVRTSAATTVRDDNGAAADRSALPAGTALRVTGTKRGDALLAASIVVIRATVGNAAAVTTATVRPGVAAAIRPAVNTTATLPAPTATPLTRPAAAAVRPSSASATPGASPSASLSPAVASPPVTPRSNAASLPSTPPSQPTPSATPARSSVSGGGSQAIRRPSAKDPLSP